MPVDLNIVNILLKLHSEDRIDDPRQNGGTTMPMSQLTSQIDSFIPAAIGGTLCILSIIGIRELLSEAKVAVRKAG